MTEQSWIGKPLDMGSDLRAETANARHLSMILADTRAPRRASAAAQYAHDLLDRTLAAHVAGPVACAKGCNLCCHTFVSATIPEIFRLAEQVRDTAPILTAAREARAIGQARRFTARVSCPLLQNGLCGGYDGRPLACRTMLSRSLAACTAYFPINGSGALDYAPGAREARGRVEMILLAALALAGLPGTHVEMIQGLAVALTEPDAERRWLNGEDVFAGVENDSGDANGDLATWVPILMSLAQRAW
ncbi:MAG: YkgJ family cysteine cluster protein [Rhodospirillaceae bacterium]|nr:YkgJ family cysteine cluster protein [Rhodospirillaceae bacterium]